MTKRATERKLSDQTLEAQSFYNQHYEVIAWHKLEPATKTFIGDRTQRICRFCHRTPPNVQFKKIAHAFPEFIGNRMLIAYDECDFCNSKFGEFETHFSRYMGLELTLSQIKGKKGIPKYKVRGEGPSVVFDASTKRLLAAAHVDHGFIHLDTVRSQLSIRWQRQGYVRRLAFKCLVKMALSITPTEILPNFVETVRWLVEDSLVPGAACFKVIRSRSVESLRAIEAVLLTRKSGRNHLPYAIFFIIFYNFTFQIFVPFSSLDTNIVGREVNIPRLPSKMESFSEVFYFTEDMSSTELLQGETAELNLSYEGPIKVREGHL